MQYTIAAIPTRYNGTQFRSRLEARWAAFFDLCNWRWDYEPIDLKGWAPDFILENRLFVEIKPIAFTTNPAKTELSGFLEKCKNCPVSAEFLILGTSPIALDEFGAFAADDGTIACIGMLCTMYEGRDAARDDGILKRTNSGDIDIGGNYFDWSGRLKIPGDGLHRAHKLPSITVAEMYALWREAGNAVQWQAR